MGWIAAAGRHLIWWWPPPVLALVSLELGSWIYMEDRIELVQVETALISNQHVMCLISADCE